MRAVTVLQHVAVEGPGTIADALRAHGLAERRVRVHEGDPVPGSAADMAGLVVMGGPMGVADAPRLPYLRDELRLLGAALRAEVPVLGVCLGSQLLAAALGAVVAPGPAKEIGWFPVSRTPAAAADALFAGAPDRFTAFHWHGDVFALPAGATSLAASEQTACQAFRWGRAAWGLLFHLEVDAAAVGRMVGAFPDELAAAGGDPDAVLAAAERHLPPLAAVGRDVFGRWAALARQRALTAPPL